MPGVEATTGRLTSEAQRLIDDARMSIVCSSFNFTPHSGMWTALKNAAVRPGLSVTVLPRRPRRLPGSRRGPPAEGDRLRTLTPPGRPPSAGQPRQVHRCRPRVTLLTSANFSYSAENTNIELGLLVHDTNLAASIEVPHAEQARGALRASDLTVQTWVGLVSTLANRG